MLLMPDGVFPTMITPFTEENEVDMEGVANITKWYVEKGCQGIFAVCQSSEMTFLSLEERVRIAKTVKQTAGKDVCVVASGHIGHSMEEQAYEMNAMAQSGCDGLVLVGNRLDLHNDGDVVFLNNAEKLLSLLDTDLPLGFYESPVPYKRLLTPNILKWCLETNRFGFIKDTCCSPCMLKERLALLKGSHLKLYNANGQTALYSLRLGAAGYSGVMANFHPELYVWLCNHPYHPFADRLQGYLSLCAGMESMHYPLNAKYRMIKEGLFKCMNTRKIDKKIWSEYHAYVTDQQWELEKEVIGHLNKHA